MCLHKITEYPVNSSFGYKVFRYEKEGLYSVFQGSYTKIYPINKKLYEMDYRFDCKNLDDFTIIINEDNNYNPGFHIFLNSNDARVICNRLISNGDDFVIYKVEFNNIIVKGVEISNNKEMKVIVVKEMTILYQI